METLYENVKSVLVTARTSAVRAVNSAMVEAYWNVGRLIVEDEQQGQTRAQDGKQQLKYLSERLTDEFGKGFTETNLKYMRLVFLAFPIRHTLRDELSWSYYRLLTKVETPKAREWYMAEAVAQNWSSRALERQINSLYYERLLATRETDRPEIRAEADEKTRPLHLQPKDILKDPYILEFLDLKPDWKLYEKDIEQGLIDNLQRFMLELGKGFAFVARQQRISTDSSHFFIDLVFYNYLLRCFVLIDLKTTKLTHQDIGQLDMYVRKQTRQSL